MTQLPEILPMNESTTESAIINQSSAINNNNNNNILDDSPPLPPSIEELARIERQEKMLEKMMERKLAILEAEYSQCLEAENNKNNQIELKDGEIESLGGYQQVTVTGQTLSMGPSMIGNNNDGNFSEAWGNFQRDMEDDADSDSDSENENENEIVDNNEILDESLSLPLHAPLTAEKISSIKSVMSGIKLRPPPWAIGQSEDQWMARILERAGFMRQQQQRSQSLNDSPSNLLLTVTNEKKLSKKEKKKRKKRKSNKSNKQISPAVVVVNEEFADFDVEFPANETANIEVSVDSNVANVPVVSEVSQNASVSAA